MVWILALTAWPEKTALLRRILTPAVRAEVIRELAADCSEEHRHPDFLRLLGEETQLTQEEYNLSVACFWNGPPTLSEVCREHGIPERRAWVAEIPGQDTFMAVYYRDSSPAVIFGR